MLHDVSEYHDAVTLSENTQDKLFLKSQCCFHESEVSVILSLSHMDPHSERVWFLGVLGCPGHLRIIEKIDYILRGTQMHLGVPLRLL